MSAYLEMDIDAFRAQDDYTTHYWTLVGLWRAKKIELDSAKADELHYRLLLGKATFADPVEGSNVHCFGDSKKAAKLTLKQTINRTVDPAAIGQCIETLRETIGAAADAIVRWKPDLAITNYKALTDTQRAALAPAITAKPGTPQLEWTDAKE